MKILSMRMMRTPIRVRQKNKTTKWQLNYSQSIINIKELHSCFKICCVSFSLQVQHCRTRMRTQFQLRQVRTTPSSVALTRWLSWGASHQIPSMFLWLRPSLWQTSPTSCRLDLLLMFNLLTCHTKYFLWVISALWHCIFIHLVFCANSFKYHYMPEIFGSKENHSTI